MVDPRRVLMTAADILEMDGGCPVDAVADAAAIHDASAVAAIRATYAYLPKQSTRRFAGADGWGLAYYGEVVSTRTAVRFLRRVAASPLREPRPTPDYRYPELHDPEWLWRQVGRALEDIAADVGCSHQAVHSAMQKLGVPTMPAYEARAEGRRRRAARVA